MLKNAYERLQIFKKTSSFYHLQTSGLVEKTNGAIIRMLKKMLNQKEACDVLLDEVFYSTKPRRPSKDSLYLSFCMDSLHDFYIKRWRQLEKSWWLRKRCQNRVATREDVFLRTQELGQDVLIEKAGSMRMKFDFQPVLCSRRMALSFWTSALFILISLAN